MQIFLSWSGEQSRKIADALREWLPFVLPAANLWMSATDIDRGARWSHEILEQLEKSNIGLICLTPDNLEAPWILFEAGALSKALTRTLVCTYLFQMQPTDVKGPLSQFQATIANKIETYKLITTMNRALGTNALPEDRLARMFEAFWPDLDTKLKLISSHNNSIVNPSRPDRDILEEILAIVRRNDLKDEIQSQEPQLHQNKLHTTKKHQNYRDSIPDNTLIYVDTHPLMGADGREVTINYPVFGTVTDFLDGLYGLVAPKVPPSTFGKCWALRDSTSQKEFRDLGRTWAKNNLRREDDNRSLEEVGLHPGMRLEAISIDSTP